MDDERELAYYRAVEDFFATLRGVPHALSAKDTHLVRTWWAEDVPLAAVTAGLTEVFQRRRDRDEDDPVVSLWYCRHAVRRQARHLAEMHTGSASDAPDETGGDGSIGDAAESLATSLELAAADLPLPLRAVENAIHTIITQLRAAADLPPTAFEEHLFSLETALLQGCWTALPEGERQRIESIARHAAEASGATGDALQRTWRALRDRELRKALALPRLEIP